MEALSESEALPLYPLSFGAGEKILPIWSVVRLSLSTWLPVFPNAVSRAKEEGAARACVRVRWDRDTDTFSAGRTVVVTLVHANLPELNVQPHRT